MDSSSVQKTIRDFLGCIAERIVQRVSDTRTLGMTRESKERRYPAHHGQNLAVNPYSFPVRFFHVSAGIPCVNTTDTHHRSIMCNRGTRRVRYVRPHENQHIISCQYPIENYYCCCYCWLARRVLRSTIACCVNKPQVPFVFVRGTQPSDYPSIPERLRYRSSGQRAITG